MKLETLEKDNYYHIYNKGINGTSIFFNEQNKIYFLKQFNYYLSDCVSIYAYCLMDNHFHFVVKINEETQTVTQKFSNFFNSYVKSVNKENDRTGSLFEKHFKRIRLENEDYLRNLIIYVHLNPKNHLDENFEDFTYSSYQSFLSSKTTKLEREEVLELFGGIDNFIFCHKNSTTQCYFICLVVNCKNCLVSICVYRH